VLLVLVDPSNPLGTALSEAELAKLARVLDDFPSCFVLLDEAYTEMRFAAVDGPAATVAVAAAEPKPSVPHTAAGPLIGVGSSSGCAFASGASLLRHLSPSARRRCFVLRSGTKSMSMSGERQALMLLFDWRLRALALTANSLTCAHAPRSNQHAYAAGLSALRASDLGAVAAFYGPQVRLMHALLSEIGCAAMADAPVAGFYVIADLRRLLGARLDQLAPAWTAAGSGPDGSELPSMPGSCPDLDPCVAAKAVAVHSACVRLMQRMLPGRFASASWRLRSDEDLCVALLVFSRVALAPLSWFGLDERHGWLRVTCSAGFGQMRKIAAAIRFRMDEREMHRRAEQEQRQQPQQQRQQLGAKSKETPNVPRARL